jgi:hypothetical protein
MSAKLHFFNREVEFFMPTTERNHVMNRERAFWVICLVFIVVFSLFSYAESQKTVQGTPAKEQIYYARCNLKVIKGNYITWVNWQSTPIFIPVGTEFTVERNGSEATLQDVKQGNEYRLDIGADGDVYLEKFVSKNPVSIKEYPTEIQANIRNTVARIGMTKEQVYIAMGPPAWAGEKTHKMTYDEIMAADLWVYKRRRFGKNIGVGFDYETGKVNRTEGIWR